MLRTHRFEISHHRNSDKGNIKEEKIMEEERCYCVTGGGGYIGSSLVKTLLLKGHTVHATLRNPNDESKTLPLTSLEGAKERLRLFKADLLEEGSFDEAIKGCHGVFHVATPIPTSPISEEDLLEVVMKGTMNVLRSCSRTPSVKRVVHTSSVTAAFPINPNGEIQGPMDDSTWTPVDILRRETTDIAMKTYAIAKTLTEQAVLRYEEENGLQVITVLPAVVGGSLIPSFPSISCELILSPITGNTHAFEAAKFLRRFLGSFTIVHIEDVCEAHVLVMENPDANGRYICCGASPSLIELVDIYRCSYPISSAISGFDKEEVEMGPIVEASSVKLKELGFVYKHGIESIVDGCIGYALDHDYLKDSEVKHE